jgi:transposase
LEIDLAALPDDVEMLQKLVRSLAAERTSLREAQVEIERLNIIIKKLQRIQFGRRSERLDDDQLQLGFEDLKADLARAEAILPSARARTARTQDERPSLPRTCHARMSALMLRARPALAVAARCI